MLPRTYVRYSIDQILYLKQHYHLLSNAELAAALSVDSPRKVQKLARRLKVKWRAENGAPQWREPKGTYHQPGRMAA